MPRLTPSELLQKYWFIGGVLICVAIASVLPEIGAIEGPLNPNITAKYFAHWLIFLISGVTVKREDLLGSLYRMKLNAFTQLSGLFAFPLLVKFFAALLSHYDPSPWVMNGFVALACLPCPVSSTVILTQNAGGNEATAIVNAMLSNVLGVFVVPVTLFFFLGTATSLPVFPTFEAITIQVGLPLAVGQLIRQYAGPRVQEYSFYTIKQLSTLYIVFIALCQTFLNQDLTVTAPTLLYTVLGILALQLLSIVLVCLAARQFDEFSDEDISAIVFCTTQKSLSVGIPILRTLYSGYAHLAAVSMPMLIYHPMQIILGGLVTEPLKDWLAANPRPHRS